MSYEFLDKLISKKIFRENIQFWIENVYFPTLTKSSEDEHTRYFLNFILNAMNVKESTENSKQKYLEFFPEVVCINSAIDKVFDMPTLAGIFVEYECMKHSCQSFRIKVYGFIGNNVCVDFERIGSIKCLACNGNIKIFNIGVIGCKYFLEGKLVNEEIVIAKDMNNYYNTIDEFHFYE